MPGGFIQTFWQSMGGGGGGGKIMCIIPYSAKFSRRQIFADFVDLGLSPRIKPCKNFPYSVHQAKHLIVWE